MVVDDAAEAARLAGAGHDVVLVVSEDAPIVEMESAGPGRIALFVGRLDEPGVRDAARAMAAELFGSD